MKHQNPILNNLEKIVVNVGVGKLRAQSQFDEKVLPEVIKELTSITGQAPAVRKAKKSIAGFKTREGDTIGLQVTLRRARMADFFTKVIATALPRVKDFRGIEQGTMDEKGNLNIGFREHVVFPEIIPEKSKINFGMQVTIVPRVRGKEKARALYQSLGVPLKKK